MEDNASVLGSRCVSTVYFDDLAGWSLLALKAMCREFLVYSAFSTRGERLVIDRYATAELVSSYYNWVAAIGLPTF